MKPALKNLFQLIWSIYFLIAFSIFIGIAFVVFVVRYYIFKKNYNETKYKDFLFRKIGKGIMLSSGIKMEKHYHSHYDAQQAYVVVGNHNTAIDIPVNTSTCPKNINIKFLSKAEASKIPILGVLIAQLCVLVDRKNATSRKRSFTLMAEEIKKGYSIFLYPEGARNRSKALVKDFYDGAFRLAIDHQIPLVVCTIVGAKKVNSPHKMLSVQPGKIAVHWEKPISTKGMTSNDIAQLKQQAKKMMLERLT